MTKLQVLSILALAGWVGVFIINWPLAICLYFIIWGNDYIRDGY